MSRQVHAFLIVADSKQSTVPACVDAGLKKFEDMLRKRFSDQQMSIMQLRATTATKATVTDKFKDIVHKANKEDLVVVLFIGHGYSKSETAEKPREQGWQLFDGEFSDINLAAHLQELKDGVEVFITSDACYGVGIAEPGALPPSPPPQDLESLSKELSHGIVQKFSVALTQRRERGDTAVPRLVCIASSSESKVALVCSEFIEELCKSIDSARSYEDLLKRMSNTSLQFSWALAAEPYAARKLPPLSPIRLELPGTASPNNQ